MSEQNKATKTYHLKKDGMIVKSGSAKEIASFLGITVGTLSNYGNTNKMCKGYKIDITSEDDVPTKNIPPSLLAEWERVCRKFRR